MKPEAFSSLNSVYTQYMQKLAKEFAAQEKSDGYYYMKKTDAQKARHDAQALKLAQDLRLRINAILDKIAGNDEAEKYLDQFLEEDVKNPLSGSRSGAILFIIYIRSFP